MPKDEFTTMNRTVINPFKVLLFAIFRPLNKAREIYNRSEINNHSHSPIALFASKDFPPFIIAATYINVL